MYVQISQLNKQRGCRSEASKYNNNGVSSRSMSLGGHRVLSKRTGNTPNDENKGVLLPFFYKELLQRRDKSSQKQEIKLAQVEYDDPKIIAAVKSIKDEYAKRGGDQLPEKKDFQCSGEGWQSIHAGYDVSQKMSVFSNLQPTKGESAKDTEVFLAYYQNETTNPIAIMELETRRGEKNREYTYIRWLLSSPERKGGGSILIEKAKEVAKRRTKGLLKVDSAKSAVEWYLQKQFVIVGGAGHSIKGPCRCLAMEWQG